jgi:hypothetical protein
MGEPLPVSDEMNEHGEVDHSAGHGGCGKQAWQ